MAAAVAEPPHQPPSSSSPSLPSAAKTILGRYQTGKLLGKGSFAKVYLARSLTTNQAVAVKVIDKAKTHPSMEPRIVAEVAAMRRLKHPNILNIHEVLASKSKIYLVMELAKGGDLFGKLSRRADHRFPEPIARKYFHQLISALHYCHQNGVAHRDVKPQNLLLDEEGNIKVSDFGLSAVASVASKDKLMLQTSCGTPAFAAPEIVGKTRNGYDGSKADAYAYLKVHKIGEANELFEMMLLGGCIPTVVTYTALIDGYCKSGNIDKACQIYARMRGQENIPDVDMYFKVKSSEMSVPNVYTYGALVDGLCKSHKVKDAHKLLDAMFADGCEPNHIVYDALIDGFCKVGELDKAQEIFTLMSERGYSPNIYTYASFIDKMFKDKRLDLALKILSKMLESDCAPNVVIYTQMIDGLCKSQKIDEAYKLMLMMDEKGCHPNVVTYTAMIDGFGKAGKMERCLELFNLMHEKGCAPNYVTYRVLINLCCSFGLLDKAHHLLEEMKQTYWPIHFASYQKVIEGFNQEFIVSLGLVDVLRDNEHVPVAAIYKVLVNSFCKAGRLDTAVQLCKEISSFASFHTVAHIYSLLIKSLCLASKVDEGFELFADLTRNGGVPEPSVFFHLITGLIKLNRWEEALQLSHSTCLMGVKWLPSGEMVQWK